MNEGQLPTFEDGKVYLVKGKTLNTISRAIIKEIIVDAEEMTVEQEGNKVTLGFAEGVLGDDIENVTMVVVDPETSEVKMYEGCTLKGELGTQVL